MKKHAVVIGAGPAGLCAAYELLARASSEWDVTIVEASPWIGGISRSVCHNGRIFDIGPHRFFSKSEEINRLWNEILPLQGAPSRDDILLRRKCILAEGGPDPETSEKVMLRRPRLTRIYYLRHFFDYPISVKPATVFALGIWRTWKAGWSYLYSALFKRPERSLEDFYINRFGRVLYSMFFEDYTEKLWGIHPSKISPAWGAQRVKGLSLRKALLNVFTKNADTKETSLVEEFFYPKRGSGQFWEALAERVREMGGVILNNATAVGFQISEGNIVSVEVRRTNEGVSSRVCCDAVFSSMPISELVPALGSASPEVESIARNLPYRDLLTVNVLVDKMAIQNSSKIKTLGPYIPDVWIYVQERQVRMGRLEIYNNFSPYLLEDYREHAWLAVEYFCHAGDVIWSRPDADAINYCIDELKSSGILPEDVQVLDSVCTRTPKAYPAYFGVYSQFHEVRSYLDSFRNLYCVGRNGQHRYNNMDHSMMCGLLAARALLGISSKSALWDVNTETEYHESK